MAHTRRFHEPGVGGRTGISVGDAALDLDAFFQAGRRALGGQSSHSKVDRAVDDSKIGIDTEDDEYNDPGLARSAASTSYEHDGDGNSSRMSMVIDESPAPSPRTTLRRTMPLEEDVIRDGDRSAYNHKSRRSAQSSSAHRSPSSFPRESVVPLAGTAPARNDSAKRPRAFRISLEADATTLSHSTEEIGPSSPSPVHDRRLAFKKGLRAGSNVRQTSRQDDSQSEAMSSIASPSRSENEYSGKSSTDGEGSRADVLDDHERIDQSVDYRGENVETMRSEESKNDSQASAPASPVQAPKKRAFAVASASKPAKIRKPRQVASHRKPLQAIKASNLEHLPSDKFDDQKSRKNLPVSKKTKASEGDGDGRLVERVPSSFQRQAGMQHAEDEDGGEIRRSTRYRYKPLEYWRGERVRYGRPSLPSSSGAVDSNVSAHQSATDRYTGDDTIDADTFEDEVSAVPPPVAVLKEIIRIPRAEGEGTFTGLKIRTKSKTSSAESSAQVKSKADLGKAKSNKGTIDNIELDPTAPTRHFEDGWDKDTPARAKIIDSKTGQEVEQEISRTAAQMRPRMAAGCTFGFEKVFVVDDFMATGVLFLLIDGQKPIKNSKDNFYTFTVLEGCVKVVLNRTSLVIAPQGMVFIPSGNDYSIENMSQRVARLAFTQGKRTKSVSA